MPDPALTTVSYGVKLKEHASTIKNQTPQIHNMCDCMVLSATFRILVRHV